MTVLKQEQWDYVRENYLVTADVLKQWFNWVTYRGKKCKKSCRHLRALEIKPHPKVQKSTNS